MRDWSTRSFLPMLTSLSLMFVAAPAMAQGLSLNATASDTLGDVSAEAPSDRWRYTVGLGMAVVPDYEGSENYEPVPLPVARVQKGYRYGQLFGLKVSSNLVQHPNYRAGPVLNFRPKRNDVENDNVANQAAVDEALEIGVKLGYDLQLDDGVLGAELELVQDVIDGHDGGLITPEINYRRPLGDHWSMRLATSITYATDHYMNSYFSVSPLEAARTGLPAFDADAGIKDVSVKIGLGYEITESWGLGVIGGYKRLLNDAEDSPITKVGDKHQFIVGLYITYSWSGQ